jgi:DNA-binding NarL/FixJ family response regulator
VIRVVLLSDVRLHREGIAALLTRDKRFSVTTGAPQLDCVPRSPTPPDVVLVDASANRRPDAIRRLAAGVREPIVALGVPDDEQDVIAFAECGVLGFVEREAPLDELVATLVSAARREARFPPRIATTLLRRVSSLASRRARDDATALTVRERQIVELIAEGLSNKEIAQRLSIEVATVKNHVHNILEKLDVTRRSDAVARLRLVEGGADVLPISAKRSTTGPSAG